MTEAMTDILDIEEITAVDWTSTVILATIVALLVLALMIWLYKKFIHPRFYQSRAKQLSPREKALHKLQQLDQQKFLERGDYRKYYFFLCDVFRQYLVDRFAYPAIDKTTAEMAPDLELVLPVSADLKTKIASLLRHADEVKFARVTPSAFAPQEDRDSLLQLIEQTQPSEGSA